MLELSIRRSYFSNGTNGILSIGNEPICKTIELPWKMNQRLISCIPEGRYAMKLRYSKKYAQHLILDSVPNRSLILIHPANNAMLELRGCIAPVTELTGQGRGSGSRKAMNKLLQVVLPRLNEGEEILLVITH
jgi:hypothetical protein